MTNPLHGQLTGTAPNLTYTPDVDYAGTDSFTYQVSDGVAASNTATVSITVNPVNDQPVANAQTLSTDEDTALTITLTGSDADNDALSYQIIAQPLNGSISGTLPQVIYTPNPDFHGSDSLSFQVNDGVLSSATATVSITVNAVNDAPVMTDQALVTDEDTPLAVTLSATDTEADPLSFSIVSQPLQGILTGAAANLIYQPNPDFNGSDSFTVKATDESRWLG